VEVSSVGPAPLRLLQAQLCHGQCEEYGCISRNDGARCSNNILVRRDHIEASILEPIRKGLLSPERAAKMVEEMHAMVAEHARAVAGRLEQQPRQLAELDARIDRLRERQGQVTLI